MFGITYNKVLEQQIQAAHTEIEEIERDPQDPIDHVTTLRRLVQMKQRVSCFLLSELEDIITRFTSKGVSSVSLMLIGESYQQALEASSSQMQIFANELAKLTHNTEMEECYKLISERLISQAESLVNPLRESKEKALADLDDMVFAEIYEPWHNLNQKPI